MAQNNFPKEYFSPPLDIPMQLSGNFGELRPNHFHAGFDFKTQQKEGLKVYAAAEGYVSRIKISTFGNGKTIYITHPNGYTSVYAHLQKAVGSIQDFITKTHYKEQAFEIEMYLKPGEIPIKKGEWIAISGNTGASEGPHLHFEIRDSKTEYIINPMLFGFDSGFKDTKKPSISGLYVYPLTPKSTVNKSQRPILLNYSLQKDGTFLADKVVANGEIGFGIIADDYDDVSFNKNGVYSVHSFLNGQPRFGYQFDTYSFDDMRYVNALIDYAKYKKTKQRVQKLFMKNKYGLSFIKTEGPTSLACNDTELPNQGSDYHAAGFSSPVGKLNSLEVSLEDASPEDLEKLHIAIGSFTQLVFESGIQVSGTVLNILKNGDKIILISFENCTVLDQDLKVLFLPEWGIYDMAVGEKIVSVFNGVADKSKCVIQESVATQKSENHSFSAEELRLQAIYATIRQIREKQEEFTKLPELVQEIMEVYPQDWLSLLEIYEIAKTADFDHSFSTDLRNHLNTKIKENPNFSKLISDGLMVIETLS